MHLAVKSGRSRNTPLSLPAGRARLFTQPFATGSDSRSMAITAVAGALVSAAVTAGGLTAQITSTDRAARSVASRGSNSMRPSASAGTIVALLAVPPALASPSLTAVMREPTAKEPG
jgi:hypothetical protein